MKKVYICSSLKLPNFEYVTELLAKLPQAIYLRPRPEELTALKRQDTVETDVAMMNYCDEIWVLGSIGRDCTWEIGYAAGIKKPVKVLIDIFNRDTIKADWMLLHGETLGLLNFYNTINEFKNGVLSE